MDKELLLLDAIGSDTVVSQRELSKRTGLSLGAVNILLKKMIREGFIKLEKIPSDRFTYMMTSKGIEEKIRKTRVYIQSHYTAIKRMQMQLESLFGQGRFRENSICIQIEHTEIRELVMYVLGNMAIDYCEKVSAGFNGIVISDAPNLHLTTDYQWVEIMNYLSPTHMESIEERTQRGE